MNKKVVVLGGGTGLSSLLKGLKDFPVDITAIITVSDSGRSAGKLRKEFHTPAVGDIRKVIINLSQIDEPIKEMMSYRFKTSSDLNGHALGNLVLTAMLDITGSLKDSIKYLSKLLDVRHTVLPLSEDKDITIMGLAEDGRVIEGEEEITQAHTKLEKVFYKKEPTVLREAIEAIHDADLIILSMGSLYTSILPIIISKQIQEAIDNSSAPLMYLCNIVTQPGETEGFTVSKHIELLNSNLNYKKISVVVANSEKIEESMARKYATEEQKDPVLIDEEEIRNMGVELIGENLAIVDEDNTLRHNSLKLSSIIFSYLMRE